MSFIALLTWISAGGLGLYLLSIWLIEYDKEYQAAAATRLPPAVLAGHVLFAGGGLLVWIAYLIYDLKDLAWASVLALVLAAALGLTMAIRWLSVYRAKKEAERAAASLLAAAAEHGDVPVKSGGLPVRSGGLPLEPGRPAARPGGLAAGPGGLAVDSRRDVGPPERNFPLLVVVAHGAFAVTTVALALLTALGIGGS